MLSPITQNSLWHPSSYPPAYIYPCESIFTCESSYYPSTTTISVNGNSATSILQTQLSTNDVWSGMVTQASGAQAKLNAYHPPLVRIHAGTDGWPGALPEIQYGKWDFSPLNELVNYDFLSVADGKAIPYGVYDLLHNHGFVNVGIDHDTAEFAVESIRRWWQQSGKALYPGKHHLLITADGGGSNGARNRLWKKKLSGAGQ